MAAIVTEATMSSVETRINQSQATFLTHVWPLIRHKFGEGELIAAEGKFDDRLARALDFAGIDYLLAREGADPFGIAQRTSQRGPHDRPRVWPWNTITTGVTQFNRLLRAWQSPLGHVTPAVIVQSYVSSRRDGSMALDSVGIVRTGDFMNYAARAARSVVEWAGDPFYVWPFNDLTAGGVHVDRFPSPTLQAPFGLLPGNLAIASSR